MKAIITRQTLELMRRFNARESLGFDDSTVEPAPDGKYTFEMPDDLAARCINSTGAPDLETAIEILSNHSNPKN